MLAWTVLNLMVLDQAEFEQAALKLARAWRGPRGGTRDARPGTTSLPG